MRIDYKEQAGIAMNARTQLADAVSDRQVTLGALAFADELGAILWHMKYGQDVKRAGLRRATLLLASRVRSAGKFKRSKFTGFSTSDKRNARLGADVERASADIIERFAVRIITEWVADLCPTCHGRRWIPRASTPRVAGAVPLQCPTCAGAGKPIEDEAARARAIGVELHVYRRHWSRLFAWTLAVLDQIDADTGHVVREQMRWK
ncbi:hypothetical protein PEP31012_00871 [Pandoraea eparura]|uniref:Uncharacterized protein n=1 Tax=Pandoraea eparura TaxID=2508291 RepID=A0A5E4SLE9_9BURK|nr:hypothetical protein [Pandoraea eparura]VVD76527.1 hypothetical protein PEP31012_00871 [Pandoraea eparura]